MVLREFYDVSSTVEQNMIWEIVDDYTGNVVVEDYRIFAHLPDFFIDDMEVESSEILDTETDVKMVVHIDLIYDKTMIDFMYKVPWWCDDSIIVTSPSGRVVMESSYTTTVLEFVKFCKAHINHFVFKCNDYGKRSLYVYLD